MRRSVLAVLTVVVVVGCAVSTGAPRVSGQEPVARDRAPWAAGADFVTAHQFRDPAGIEYMFAVVEYA